MVILGILVTLFGLVIVVFQLKSYADNEKSDNEFSQAASWQTSILGVFMIIIGLIMIF